LAGLLTERIRYPHTQNKTQILNSLGDPDRIQALRDSTSNT
jgi:hypothetical protein